MTEQPVPTHEREVSVAPLPVMQGMAAAGLAARQAWSVEQTSFPIVTKPGRQKWNDQISDFRTGQVIFEPRRITITGKAVLPLSTRALLMFVSFAFFLGWVIVALVLEYVIRRDRTDQLTWDEVDALIVESPKNRVCLIYHHPAKPKTKYALGLKLDEISLREFVQIFRANVPERVIEGKIGPAPPLLVWIVAYLVIVGLFLLSYFVQGRP